MSMKKKGDEVTVYVTTVDACIAVQMKQNTKGKDLFQAVCKKLNVYETNYFGLRFTSTENEVQWLEMDNIINMKKIKKQHGKLADFEFRIKFYPECAQAEIIQDTVKELFFKQELSRMFNCTEIYFPPEELVCATVAFICYLHHENPTLKHEDILESRFDKIFTPNIMRNFELTKQEWMDEILSSLKIAKDQHYIETIDMALKVMEQSPTYGIAYYNIVNKKGTILLLGLDCYGINIYRPPNKITPTLNFIWSEVHSVSFNKKRFKIKMIDKTNSKFVFYTASELESDQILSHIVGNHKRYIGRRANVPETSPEIREARKQKESDDVKKKKFEKQKQTEHVYEETVKQIVQTGLVDEAQTKQVEDSFNAAKKALEEQIEQARLLSQQEQAKREKIEQEKLELEFMTKELTEKLILDEKERNQHMIHEAERLSREEAQQKEIEALKQKLLEVELKHQEDMRKLEELKKTCATSEQTLHKVTPEIKTVEYQDISKMKNDAITKKIEKFSTLAKSKVSTDSRVAVEFQQFGKKGLGKFETLTALRKNNTRDRIDEFESLI